MLRHKDAHLSTDAVTANRTGTTMMKGARLAMC